jgi:hypothetical protein
MIATHRRIVIAFALAAAGQARAQAMRRFTPVEDLRIGALSAIGQRDMLVTIAPDGRAIVAPRYGGMPIIAFDSLGKRLSWKVSVGPRDDAEIGIPSRIGWIAGTRTMWVADQGYHQVALVDSTGKVFKSIEDPSWIHPSWAERRKYPVFATMQVFALYKDESMLLLPGRERALLDTPGYDRSGLHLLRASWSGAIQRTVAMVPETQAAVVLRGKGCEHVATIPFASRPMWSVSADGSRIVIATPGVSLADSGTLRLTVIGERGDTLFSRTLVQPAVRVPQASIDNLLSNQRACGAFSVEAIRDSLSRRVSVFKSFLVAVLPGRDQTTWVTMRAAADTSMERTAIGLDERGEIIGAVALPVNQTLVGADRGHIWMVETGRMRSPAAIVRYRLDATPAPPPRTGRGGTPPGLSRSRE